VRVLERRPDARLRLLCLPYAGGGAAIFRAWPSLLPPDVEVCAIQLPGRESRFREPPRTDRQDLLDDMQEGVLPALTGRYAIFGHSLGALLGFDLAHRLRAAGRPPVHYFASGCRAPHMDPAEVRRHLSDEEFLASVSGLNGIPPELVANEELMSLLLPVIRADFTLAETYRYEPRPPLDVPITAFAGVDDPEAGPARVAPWAEYTVARFQSHTLPGDHFFIQTAAAELLRLVGADLRRYLPAAV
jgi:surfactin synthase thioesterase subunit